MGINITTYQLPDEGQDPKVYADALRSLEILAMDFGRSKGLISWIQGQILLRAREACLRGGWKAFLASVHLKPGTAGHLLRIGKDISAENKNLEYNEMLAIIYPNTYGKDAVEKRKRGGGGKRTTQTVDQSYADLASIKTKVQKIGERKFLESKLPLDQAILKYNQSIGVIEVCSKELAKLKSILEKRQAGLTIHGKQAA